MNELPGLQLARNAASLMIEPLSFRIAGRWCATLLALMLLATTGCGDSSAKLTAKESDAFANAPAEIRQQWDKAIAADKAGDYSAAQISLDALTQLQLDEEQKQALEKERADFGQRLMAAAEKNDPAAVKAVQESNKLRNQNRRAK
jgi:hypothetical protein